MAVLQHGGMGQVPSPVTLMADLYHPAKPQANPASTLLLTFEKRTLLGHLPPEIRLQRTVLESLMDDCQDTPAASLGEFWGNLDSHVQKHLTSDEQPHLEAAARALRAEMQSRGVDLSLDPTFFPATVTDAASYAALARAILFLAVLPASPLRLRLYSARGDFVPYGALNLNIDVPEGFLQAHGEAGTREVVVGLALAIAERVVTPKEAVFVPILNQELYFSTLYAPDPPSSSRLRQRGRSGIVVLQ